MTRAALYARVSTEEQTTDGQVVELREAAGRLRLEVVRVEAETGSGAKADRPGLLALLEAARRGEFSALLVVKLDRLGRSLLDLVKNLDELRRLRVRVVAVSQGMDLDPERDDSAARFVSQVLGAAAEYERALIRERTRSGMARVKREKRDHAGPKGTWPAGRPPASQVLLHAAAELVDRGMSIRAAAKVKGVRPTTLRRFLAAQGFRGPSAPALGG
jgi:DNA invertase Pin-like site-specific DNA recombinase